MADEERLRFPHGHRPRLRVKEQDGDPTVEGVREIRVTNATLTDEGKGVVSFDILTDAEADAIADALIATHAGDADAHHARSHDHSAAGDGQTLQPLNWKWPATSALTISGGAITVTQSHHSIYTEGLADTDDLDTINGLVQNQWYLIRPVSGGLTIVLKHNPTGSVRCVGGADIILDELWKFAYGYAYSSTVIFFTMGYGDPAVGIAAHVAAADPHALYQLEGADVSADHITEKTATHGVEIDGVLCKDDAVETDAIRGLRETTGPTALAMGAVADGEYLKRVGATVVGGTPAGGGGDEIWDADTDTGIQVEEAADEDIIRFDIAGVGDVMTLQAGGLKLAAHSAFGADAALSLGTVMNIQEADIGAAGSTMYGLKMDVGAATNVAGEALYGFFLTSRNKTVDPGTMAVLYGLSFIASHESPQALVTAYGVRGQVSSLAAGSGAWTLAYGMMLSGGYAGAKPATAIGLKIMATIAPAGVTAGYGLWIPDLLATTAYLAELGPASPYFRVVGGADPAANQTNVYVKEETTLRQVQWKRFDALAAADKVMILV